MGNSIRFFKILSVPSENSLTVASLRNIIDPILAHKPYYPATWGYVEKLASQTAISSVSINELAYGLNKLVALENVPPQKEARYAMMITRTALEKLPKIRESRFLPESTRDLLTTERVFDAYISMAECSFSPEFSDLIGKFEQISGKIGVTLAENGDPRARHWNVRKQELWDWCRVLIEDTAHPVYFQLLAEDPENHSAISKFKRLFEALVKTVVWVSFPDDLADNYKHVELTEIFNKIPFSDKQLQDSLLERVNAIDDGLFVDYFKVAIEAWQSAEKDFKELLGDSYTAHKKRLIQDYKSIVEAMKESAVMNTNPRTVLRENGGYEMHLQHNMMATSFNTIQTILVKELSIQGEISIDTVLFDPFENVDFNRLRGAAQENARRSNNLATFGRELEEFDTSNILFNKINEWYRRKCDYPKKYQDPLSHLLAQYQEEIENSGFLLPSRDPQKMDFFSLMTLRQDIENALYREYKKIDKDNYLVNFANDYSKATKNIEDKSDTLPDQLLRLKTLSAELIELIKTVANDSKAFEDYYYEWEGIRRLLLSEAEKYFDNSRFLLDYIHGWDKVHVTYLSMKYEPIF